MFSSSWTKKGKEIFWPRDIDMTFVFLVFMQIKYCYKYDINIIFVTYLVRPTWFCSVQWWCCVAYVYRQHPKKDRFIKTGDLFTGMFTHKRLNAGCTRHCMLAMLSVSIKLYIKGWKKYTDCWFTFLRLLSTNLIVVG